MAQVRKAHRTAHRATPLMLIALALAGCHTPAGMPTSGGAAAQPYPGTAGEQFAPEASRAYSLAAATALAIKSVTASVNADTAANATDADMGTAWTASSTASTLSLTLGQPATLASLAIKTTPNLAYNVDVSLDNLTWTPALTNQLNTTWGAETKAFPTGVTGTYVRIRTAPRAQVFDAKLTGSAPVAPAVVLSGQLAALASSAGTAAAAVDGNTGTAWTSGTSASPWVTLDRNATGAIASLSLKATPNLPYALEVSSDNVTWTPALSAQKNTTWGVETKPLPAGTAGRYVRVHFSGTVNAQLFEVSVAAGAPAATPAPTALPTVAPTLAPTAAPTSVPTAVPVSTATSSPTSVAIVVDTTKGLHPATSHILGTCRNHVAGDFRNGAAKLAKMKELTPTWGGGKYLYRVGHGPIDGRNDYSYMTGFHFESAWDTNNAYPYDDVRNALGDAAAIGADQMHVVNFGTSDAAEAGRYVSFLDHAGDANRAAHPVAQQNVKMFELGNEISWSMVRGHDQYAPTETAYATRAKTFAQAMRKSSDVPIQIGAVASTNSNWFGTGWSGGATTVKNILTTMGPDVDFLIYHGYPSWPMAIDGNLDTIMAQNEWNKQKLEAEIKPAIAQYANGRDVYLANTEFFSNLYNDATRSRGMFGAMYSADTLLLAMNEDIRTSVQFCFDHKDMADASFFINDDPTNTTAIFKFQKMLAQHWGDEIVATKGQNIPLKAVTGASAAINMPKLSFSAATSGNKTYVMVLNRTNDSDVASSVDVGFTPSSVTSYTLAGATGWDSANGDVTTASPANLTGLTFARASVTILEITK